MFKRIIFLGLCMFGILCTQVKADNISYKRLDNIYYNLTVDGNRLSNHVTAFYLDNRLAYCIEPGKAIITREYESSSDWSHTDLPSSVTSLLEKIGYYGYEYPNHQTDKYYIATQELIWRAIKDVDIVWTTMKDGQGDVIDVTLEKNEIMNLVKKHDEGPSFKDKIISGKVSSSLTIEDTNNVLSDYKIVSDNSHDLKIDGNKLIVKFNNAVSKIEEVLLNKNSYDNETLLVYTNGDSQKLASLRFSFNQNVGFKIQSEEEPIVPKEPTVPTEVVKVPSTGIEPTIFHFGIKSILYNEKHFG